MSRSFVSTFLLHSLIACTTLFSSEITANLDNGDSITGELVAIDEESVTLDVEYLGKIRLPLARVQNAQAFVIDEEPKSAAETVEADAKAALVTIASAGAVVEGEDEVDHEPGIGSLGPWAVGTLSHWLGSVDEWEKRLQIGLNANSGRKDQTDLNYRFDMQLKRERDQWRLNMEYYYGKAEDVVIKDRFASGFRWRQDIAPGVFYETNTNYSFDEIKRIDSNFEQKLGLGTRFLESDITTLSAGMGASGRWREFEEGVSGQEEVVYLVDVFQDWDYRFSDRLRLRQDLRMAMPLENQDEYEFSFSAALTSALTNAINLSLRYELGYDNSLAEDLKEDRRFISSLGYAF